VAAWLSVKVSWISRGKDPEMSVALRAFYRIVNRNLECGSIPPIQGQKLAPRIYPPQAGGFLSGKRTRQNVDEPGSHRTVDG
jgi:aryl-alcohol dehydrogenase-like predicted oxidoreductase